MVGGSSRTRRKPPTVYDTAPLASQEQRSQQVRARAYYRPSDVCMGRACMLLTARVLPVSHQAPCPPFLPAVVFPGRPDILDKTKEACAPLLEQ